ncbi:unnamed protein product [Cyprideis torosa]|uniref:Uncharacterized protein n=1 Tax=Cyprideis torosa TaxID=163714 RepID=A0A7R8WBV8_9CRUS|nr:unnamed protein product [Cyprideis torosa]CAG0887411.1 unnamed protein product [Cyprideis torosa]
MFRRLRNNHRRKGADITAAGGKTRPRAQSVGSTISEGDRSPSLASLSTRGSTITAPVPPPTAVVLSPEDSPADLLEGRVELNVTLPSGHQKKMFTERRPITQRKPMASQVRRYQEEIPEEFQEEIPKEFQEEIPKEFQEEIPKEFQESSKSSSVPLFLPDKASAGAYREHVRPDVDPVVHFRWSTPAPLLPKIDYDRPLLGPKSEAETPMMDLLIQLAKANNLQPGDHALRVYDERRMDHVQYQPNTPIGE